MKKALLTLLVLLGLLVAGFYFKDYLVKGITDFKKTDLGQLVEQIGSQIFAPPPLKFLTGENNVVLTASKVIEETNLQRQENSLSALKENTTLNKVALAKANDMFEKQYFEHVSPSGVGPGELGTQYGYSYLVFGENLILGNFSSEKEMVEKWMGSPGHRANILNKQYLEIGVAVVKGNYQGNTVWIGVQEFGLPSSVCPKPSESLKNQIISDKAQLNQLSLEISQKKSDINNSNPRSSEYKENVKQYNDLVNQYNALVATSKSLISQYNNQVSVYNNCVGAK